MVLSRVWGRKFDKINEKSNEIIIEVPENELNHAIGYKGENKLKLLERYKHVVISTGAKRNEEISSYDVTIIASSMMPAEAKETLSKMGSVTWLEPSDLAYPSISSHPDIFFFCKDERHCESVICAPDNSVGNKYPDTCRFNAVGVGNILIHNLQYTDKKILDLYRNLSTKSVQINVNQGYTRCNLLALNETNYITSDLGIKRVLEEHNFNVFYVDPHQITLPGQKYGFFPGCCGLVDDNLVVCGSISRLKECKELRKFVRRNGMKIIELYNGELIDVGSIFFVRQKA